MLHQKMLATGANAPAANHHARPFGHLAVHGRPLPRTAEGNVATIHTGRPTLLRPSKAVAPEKIVQAFNTWAFKREQPDSPQAMLDVIAENSPAMGLEIDADHLVPLRQRWQEGSVGEVDGHHAAV